MADKDYHRIIADLIGNAIASSKVTGENGRITRLVAGTLGRFAAELRQGAKADEAHGLVEDAARLLARHDGARIVPALTAAVEAMAAGHPTS